MHGLSGFLRRPFERGEIGEHPALRIQPVARFRLVERGLFDGIFREVRSNRHRRIQRNAPRERADPGAHIYVARAVEGSLDFLRRIPRLPLPPVPSDICRSGWDVPGQSG